MGRLKKYRFDNIDHFLEWREENETLVETMTLEKLENSFKSNKKPTLVDVFEMQLSNEDSPIKLSIFEHEWSDALDKCLKLFLYEEDYQKATRIRNLKRELGF